MSDTAGPIQVLHVDDDPEFADMAATFLEREDDHFDVRTATDADRGLEILADGDIDCILSDYDMPGQDGIEFLGRVRENHHDLPFILYTGKGSEAVASDAISAGVTDYLQKESGTSHYAVLANRISKAVEARRSADQAQRRRHRLEQILKTVPGCVTQIDAEGNFVFANERTEEVLGLDSEAVTDRTYNDPEWNLRDPGGDPIADEKLPFRRVRDTGEPVEGVRLTIEWPDGTRKLLLVNGAPVFDDDGAFESAVFSLVDITDQQQRERYLEVMERRLAAILENTTRPMFMKNADGEYIFVNQRYRELFDLEDEAVEGRTDGELHPTEMADEVRQNDQDVIERGEPIETEERIMVDGEQRVFLSSKVPVYDLGERSDPDGPAGVFGVATDITDRKQRERELERQNERLEEFASVVSHDVRNPLKIATGRVELAREDCDSEHLYPLEDALARIDRITEDVLWLAREGRDIGSTEPVTLQEITEAAWTTGSGDADGATLITPDPLPTVEADEDRLRQLLENLFRNAVDHVGDDVTVTVGELDDGFYVEDDGPGVPEADGDAVFEAGYSTSDGGTGFGLSIVERIVDAHGWEIRITEADGGGTRFEITGVGSTGV